MTWEQRLRRASKNGVFNAGDKRKVSKWPTCAIGERFNLTNNSITDGRGQLVSKDAQDMGIDFMQAVLEDMVYDAILIYNNIQMVELES